MVEGITTTQLDGALTQSMLSKVYGKFELLLSSTYSRLKKKLKTPMNHPCTIYLSKSFPKWLRYIDCDSLHLIYFPK